MPSTRGSRWLGVPTVGLAGNALYLVTALPVLLLLWAGACSCGLITTSLALLGMAALLFWHRKQLSSVLMLTESTGDNSATSCTLEPDGEAIAVQQHGTLSQEGAQAVCSLNKSNGGATLEEVLPAVKQSRLLHCTLLVGWASWSETAPTVAQGLQMGRRQSAPTAAPHSSQLEINHQLRLARSLDANAQLATWAMFSSSVTEEANRLGKHLRTVPDHWGDSSDLDNLCADCYSPSGRQVVAAPLLSPPGSPYAGGMQPGGDGSGSKAAHSDKTEVVVFARASPLVPGYSEIVCVLQVAAPPVLTPLKRITTATAGGQVFLMECLIEVGRFGLASDGQGVLQPLLADLGLSALEVCLPVRAHHCCVPQPGPASTFATLPCPPLTTYSNWEEIMHKPGSIAFETLCNLDRDSGPLGTAQPGSTAPLPGQALAQAPHAGGPNHMSRVDKFRGSLDVRPLKSQAAVSSHRHTRSPFLQLPVPPAMIAWKFPVCARRLSSPVVPQQSISRSEAYAEKAAASARGLCPPPSPCRSSGSSHAVFQSRVQDTLSSEKLFPLCRILGASYPGCSGMQQPTSFLTPTRGAPIFAYPVLHDSGPVPKVWSVQWEQQPLISDPGLPQSQPAHTSSNRLGKSSLVPQWGNAMEQQTSDRSFLVGEVESETHISGFDSASNAVTTESSSHSATEFSVCKAGQLHPTTDSQDAAPDAAPHAATGSPSSCDGTLDTQVFDVERDGGKTRLRQAGVHTAPLNMITYPRGCQSSTVMHPSKKQSDSSTRHDTAGTPRFSAGLPASSSAHLSSSAREGVCSRPLISPETAQSCNAEWSSTGVPDSGTTSTGKLEVVCSLLVRNDCLAELQETGQLVAILHSHRFQPTAWVVQAIVHAVGDPLALR